MRSMIFSINFMIYEICIIQFTLYTTYYNVNEYWSNIEFDCFHNIVFTECKRM